MGRRRGRALTELPAVINPEHRFTAEQSMQITGDGRSKFYSDVKAGKLPQPERDGRNFARWRAGDLLEALKRRRAGQIGGAE
jgi:predicted DNA-binding transcriptional regulator AlpA